MFKKVMAKFGRGSAKVDLILEQPEVPLGDVIKGEILLQGGKVKQTINKVEVELHFEVKMRESIYTHLIAVIPYQARLTLRPGQNVRVPFQLSLPYDLLLSSQTVSYFFVTQLDIAGGIDSSDRDYFQVTPPQELTQVFTALYQLGFQEKSQSRFFDGETQQFQFVPTTFLADQVSSLNFSAILEPQQVHLLVELELHSFLKERKIANEFVLTTDQLQNSAIATESLRRSLQKIVHHNQSTKETSNRGAIGKLVSQILKR